MSTRFAWLLGILVLCAIGLLVACGSHYSASSDGLVLAPSQGSAVIQTFSFNLSNGHASAISNPPSISSGVPSSIILDPAGAFAYLISSATCGNTSLSGAVQGFIATYRVNSNGTLSSTGAAVNMPGNTAYPGNFPTCMLNDATNPNPGNAPVALAIDSAGKFLFVASASEAVTFTDNSTTPPTQTTITLSGNVSVFSVGSGASLTAVPGSPFSLPNEPGGTFPDPSALAVSPTAFPAQNATCSGKPAPTSEFLYVADSANNAVVGYSVDPSSGALSVQSFAGTSAGIPTGSVPSGVAVDACRRFVYVANKNSNNVSAYTICPPMSTCADGSLTQISGSPYPAANGPGPIAIDPLGNFVYVVDTLSNQISSYKISQVQGTLTALAAAISTGTTPVAIAIRNDDNWLFVANNNSADLSQFAITPATGGLTPAGAGITTDNSPSGVAVK